MTSIIAARACEDVQTFGTALLKFMSRNDAGATAGHQYGILIPKHCWSYFTPFGPEPGVNHDHNVTVLWPDGTHTDSIVKWYGRSKSEYRLTGFGEDFPWRTPDQAGSLFVLIPVAANQFRAYVLDLDDEIDFVQSELSTYVDPRHGSLYSREQLDQEANEDNCLLNAFREFCQGLGAFPRTRVLSEAAYNITQACSAKRGWQDIDNRLVSCDRTEYDLFRYLERILLRNDVIRVFDSVDDFLRTARSITQRRMKRAGDSLEHHLGFVLRDSDVPYTPKPKIDGRPDFVFPSENAYKDLDFPVDELLMLAVKRSCRDRWNQVTKEAKRIPMKHLFTLQPTMTCEMLENIYAANVTLVVPRTAKQDFPESFRNRILTLSEFIDYAKHTLHIP